MIIEPQSNKSFIVEKKTPHRTMTETSQIFEINELVWNIISFLQETDKLRLSAVSQQFYTIISNLFNFNDTLGRWRYANNKIKSISQSSQSSQKYHLDLSEELFVAEWGIFVKVVTFDQINIDFVIWSSLDNSVEWRLSVDFKYLLINYRSNNFHFCLDSSNIVYHLTETQSVLFHISEKFQVTATVVSVTDDRPLTTLICNRCLRLQSTDFQQRFLKIQSTYHKDETTCVGEFGPVFVTRKIISQSTEIQLQKNDRLLKCAFNHTDFQLCKQLLIIRQKFDKVFDNYRIIFFENFQNYEMKVHKYYLEPTHFFRIDHSNVFGYRLMSNKSIRLFFDGRSFLIHLLSPIFFKQITFCSTMKKLYIRIMGYHVISVDIMFYLNIK